MAADIPRQGHRCPTYDWCEERGPGHRVHNGDAHILATTRGTEIRVSLTAGPDRGPVLLVEGAFNHGGPLMELTELDAQEGIELAEILMSLARLLQGSSREVR